MSKTFEIVYKIHIVKNSDINFYEQNFFWKALDLFNFRRLDNALTNSKCCHPEKMHAPRQHTLCI